MTTADPLFAAVLEHPDDDTVRLAYADALDEREPARMACPKCGGIGVNQYRTQICKCNDGQGNYGTVLDTSAADLAELIRVQCDPRCGDPCQYACRERIDYRCSGCMVRQNATDILDRHPEWLRDLTMPCPGCGGCGWVQRQFLSGAGWHRADCEACGGTGDLLEQDWVEEHNQPDRNRRTVTLDRGLTLRVACRLDEVVREGPCPGVRDPKLDLGDDFTYRSHRNCPICSGRDSVWQPTPWALAFRRACVGMGRVPWFGVTDREPHVYGDYCYWYEEERSSGVRRVGPGYVPGFLLVAMVKAGNWFDYAKGESSLRTPGAARHALELALYRFVGAPRGAGSPG